MTEAVQNNVIQPNRTQGLLISAGVLLLGLAALIIAFQWQTRTTITVETPTVGTPTGESAKVGFEIVSTVKHDLAGSAPQNYLLNKDSGRIWVEAYGGEWKEVKVESITPSSSQANYR